jgi:hypothetical protein
VEVVVDFIAECPQAMLIMVDLVGDQCQAQRVQQINQHNQPLQLVPQ